MEVGDEVICLDNYFTGRKSNIARWISYPGLNSSVTTSPNRSSLRWTGSGIWPVLPHNSLSVQSGQNLQDQFSWHLQHAGLARRWARLLLASTSEVYGDLGCNLNLRVTGVPSSIGVRSCYDEGKRVAETLCFDYQRMNGVEVRVARIFNTYGPRMLLDDGRVVSNFIVQALRGESLTLYGDGSQTRSFCYVSDLVEGLIRLMNCESSGPINLGNPDEFPIELAELVRIKINPNLRLWKNPCRRTILSSASRRSICPSAAELAADCVTGAVKPLSTLP